MDRLLRAADIVSGWMAIGGALGWTAAIVARFLFRVSVNYADWVLHSVGFGGVVGVIFATWYLLA